MRWRPVGPLKREIGWIFRTNGQRQAPAWGKHCEVNKGLCKAADKGDFWLVFLGGGEVIRLWLEKILRECTAKCYLFSLQRRSWENSLQFSMLYASLMFYVLYKINTTFEMRNIYIYTVYATRFPRLTVLQDLALPPFHSQTWASISPLTLLPLLFLLPGMPSPEPFITLNSIRLSFRDGPRVSSRRFPQLSVSLDSYFPQLLQ